MYQIIDIKTGKPLVTEEFGKINYEQFKFQSIADAIATAINQVPGFKVKVAKKIRLSSKWGDKNCIGCNTMEGALFFDDGLCRCGVNKHHYHCGICGRLIQIG